MREGQIVFWDVVEEHLDESEFLVAQRDAALEAEDYTLSKVDELLEARLFAQLDGLVVGGEAAVTRLLLPALEDEAPARVLAAALALLAIPGERGPAAVVSALGNAGEGATLALTRALGLADRTGLEGDLEARLLGELGASSPKVQAAALEALVLRGVAPGRSLARVGPADAKPLVRAALRAARLAPHAPALGELCAACLSASDPALRLEAIRSGLVLGTPGALTACRKLAAMTDEAGAEAAAGEALLLLAIAGDARDHATLLEALDVHQALARRRAAVTAVGYAGRAAGAEACLGLLGDPALGRLASEAFAAITGAPRQGPMLAAVRAQDAAEPRPLADEDLETRAAPGPDAALALLDPRAATAFWADRRASMDRQARYIDGKLLRADSVLAALTHGPMRRRHALALEVSMRSRGRLALETRAFAGRQRAELGKLGDLGGLDFQRPLG